MATKIKFKRGLEENIPQLEVGEPGFTTDSKKLFVGSDAGNIEIGALIEVTWQELKDKRDADLLTAGAQYRITDYVTTTVQANTQSAGHQFDIIVTADNVDKLNENARAVDRRVLSLAGITASIKTQLGEVGDVLKRTSYLEESISPPAGFIYAWGTNEDIEDTDPTNFVYTQSDTPSAGDAVWQGYDDEYGVVVSRIEEVYFANSKLEAWQLKYCLDNDTSRFIWADEVNGKGVIYRMIDEFNNDCPYDFKNIQFKRKLTDGKLDLDSGIDTWVYTFTLSDLITDEVVDISLKQNTEYVDDEQQYRECANNVIKEAILDYQPDGLIRIQLNDNVFLNINEEYSYYGCSNNTFGKVCINNTFGDSCGSNTFDNGCRNNTFGNNCGSNTLGKVCINNTFGDSCGSNTLGKVCINNTFGNNCDSNTFGYNCSLNTFGGGCNNNTLGNSCYGNTFGDECRYNTFGKVCQSNTFGVNCYANTFGNECLYLRISDASTTAKKYIHVENRLNGASDVNKFDLYDPAILNKDYQVTFKKSASGKYLMLWATDTGTMTGKVKESNLDTTWEDIEDALGDIDSALDAILGV